MKTCIPVIILLQLVLWLTSAILLKRKIETTQKCTKRKGESIAVDSLIHKYEQEHQKFYEQESRNGNYLLWPDLDKKNLSNFCREHIQHNIPSRKNEGATGIRIKIQLYYQNENKSRSTTVVIVVQCEVMQKNYKTIYYITRAPEPNCVYTLKCSKRKERNQGGLIFTIINKYCDFEGKPLKYNSLKYRRSEVIKMTNLLTGQPVAKSEYLLQYELEHHELLKREANGRNQIKWPYAMVHHNLNSYCNQYVRHCAPRRNIERITGTWKTQKLHYQEINMIDDIEVIIVTCLLPNVSKRHYYVTRALESNCVFALLRQRCGMNSPFVIIFKHCEFESPNDQQAISKDYDILEKYTLPKTEVKEEMLNDKLETIQFFPMD